MGIKGLFKVKIANNTTIGDLGISTELTTLKQKRIIIDANNYLIRILSKIYPKEGFEVETKYLQDYIYHVIKTVIYYDSLGIIQIWIFDNDSRDERKNKCILKKNIKESNIYKIVPRLNELINMMFKIIKKMNILCIRSPPELEAEMLGSYLMLKGKADYIMSADSDVLMYGANLLRITNSTDPSNKFKIYIYKDVLEKTVFHQEIFIYMCLLLGTDYNKKYPNIGQETVMNKIYKIDPSKEYLDLIDKIFNLFDDDINPVFKTIKLIFKHIDDVNVLGMSKIIDALDQVYNYVESLNISTFSIKAKISNYITNSNWDNKPRLIRNIKI
jgi:5'-3' exonuclease